MPVRQTIQLPVSTLLAPASCGGCGDQLAIVPATAMPRATGWCEHCCARWGPAPGWWPCGPDECAGWAAATYRGRVRRAVLQAKRGAPGALIDLLLARWPEGELPADATVCWIPAHPRRVIGRPDSGRLLAEALAARDGLPAERLLWRVPWARRQAGRADAARRADPGRLGLRAAGPAPRLVVLVDDVRTTGATLNQAAGLLHAAGAAEVIAIAVAAAPTGNGWPAGQTRRSSGGR